MAGGDFDNNSGGGVGGHDGICKAAHAVAVAVIGAVVSFPP